MTVAPRVLIWLRLACAPLILIAALLEWPGIALVAIAAVALVTDYFDGVIARRLGVDTAALRHFDSQVDTVFYCAAGIGLFIRFPNVWHEFHVGIFVLLAFEFGRMLFEWLKFGRPAAYHMWSAKLWGLVMLFGFGEVALSGRGGPLLLAVVVIGIYTNIEGMVASLILREPHHDVPTWWHAVRIAQTRGTAGGSGIASGGGLS